MSKALLPKPSPLDIDALLAFHRANFGDARMADGDGGDDAGGDAGGDGDDAGDGDSGADSDDNTELSDEEKAKLGDAGKQAIDRMKEARNKERERRKVVERELAQLKAKPPAAKPKDGDQPDLEEVRRQAREEAKAEADAAVLRDRVMDKIEAKAGARFNMKPERIAAILLRENDVEDFIDGGKVDTEAIAEALDTLLKEEPTLAAQGGKRFKGTADGGTRKETPAKATSLQDAVAARLAAAGT